LNHAVGYAPVAKNILRTGPIKKILLDGEPIYLSAKFERICGKLILKIRIKRRVRLGATKRYNTAWYAGCLQVIAPSSIAQKIGYPDTRSSE
jgi:hypothetical protein